MNARAARYAGPFLHCVMSIIIVHGQYRSVFLGFCDPVGQQSFLKSLSLSSIRCT